MTLTLRVNTSMSIKTFRNALLLVLILLDVTSLESSRVVTKIQYRDDSNRFYLNTTACNDKFCDVRNATSVAVDSDGAACGCQCKGQSVYSLHDDMCLLAGKGTGSYLIRGTQKKINTLSTTELQSGGLSITFCPDTDCVGNPVSDCKVILQNSAYDDVTGWLPLWKNENEIDFNVDENNKFKLVSNSKRYNGKLLKVWMTCKVHFGGPSVLIPSFAMFAVEGTLKLFDKNASQPITSRETTTKTFTSTTATSKTTATTLSTTTTSGTTATTSNQPEPITAPTTATITTIDQPATTTSQITTETKKKRNETEEGFSTSDKQSNDTSNPKRKLKEKEADKSSKMTLIVVTVLLGVFLIISCSLVLCFYQRWRRAKQRQANQTNEPPFFFQPQTPVFLIGRDGKQRRPQPPLTPSYFTNDLNESQQTTASDTELYSHGKPVSEKQRHTSIRHLYATIDKFLKFGNNKEKSNGSLDEGYTTDDNYDYRRFAAFPKDLYDEPGSIVSNASEPDYKIPEDFITCHAETRIEDDTDSMTPADPSLEASILKTLREQQIDLESPYDFVRDERPPRIEREITNPYDEVGEPLANKINDYKNSKGRGEDTRYDVPEHGASYVMSNGKLRKIDSLSRAEAGLSRVIENTNTLDIEYEGAVAV